MKQREEGCVTCKGRVCLSEKGEIGVMGLKMGADGPAKSLQKTLSEVEAEVLPLGPIKPE